MVFLVRTSRRSEGVTFSPVRVQHGGFGSDWSWFRRCLVLTVLSSELYLVQTDFRSEKFYVQPS